MVGVPANELLERLTIAGLRVCDQLGILVGDSPAQQPGHSEADVGCERQPRRASPPANGMAPPCARGSVLPVLRRPGPGGDRGRDLPLSLDVA
jgi:hypothetical protein